MAELNQPVSEIDRLILNTPYEEPQEHWHYDPVERKFSRVTGRREAGYVIASDASKSFDDPGHFVSIPLVNDIRARVQAWRAAGYPGVTGMTRRLLAHWQDPEWFEMRRFYFCQLEAIETLIWLTEGPEADRQGLEIQGDGGEWQRQCCKMATGAGKTLVMAMVIAWHILNKVAYPQDKRFSKNVLVIAPGLTVQKRLAVLGLTAEGNYYQAFDIVPADLLERLRQGRVLVRNWQKLAWESAERVARRRTVDKRGPVSDERYARDVLEEMSRANNLLVINDEAHHAWRVNPAAEGKYERVGVGGDGAALSGLSKSDIEEATVWVGGLDRLHRTRRILMCFDFSATPFAPSGKRSTDEALFSWIVSDFGLNDAIESGLVKTPRVVVRDDAVPDARTYKPKLYHIYNDSDVKDDLNRRAKPEELLPDLVLNAYYLLGFDWREWKREWAEKGRPTPPVMITVCNRTETAARVRYAFEHAKVRIPELCDPAGLLHIDSKVLAEAEALEESAGASEPVEAADAGDDESATPRKRTKAQQALDLREMVDTVGRQGQAGAQVQNVISVGMLSEGWDARTVTHIMGLRAFSSQLLCEQVIGRGLRRTSFDRDDQGRFTPEYVNVFGVPFSFLPHEGEVGATGGEGAPTPVLVEVDPAKREYELTWPNIDRIDAELFPVLALDWRCVEPLVLHAADTPLVAEMAPVLEGKPDVSKVSKIELERLAREFRTQRIVFQTAADVYEQMKADWKGGREMLIAQLVGLVEGFIRSGFITVHPEAYNDDDLKRRLIITLNMTRVVQHVRDAIAFQNTARLKIVWNPRPTASTADMNTWYTARPNAKTRKSHINVCVFDSTWEASDAYQLDESPLVVAWAKNDHLGFDIWYLYHGGTRKYRPDFLIKLTTDDMLVLETKGQDTDQDQVKRKYLAAWCDAVNQDGRFGRWRWDVARQPGDVVDILAKQTALAGTELKIAN